MEHKNCGVKNCIENDGEVTVSAASFETGLNSNIGRRDEHDELMTMDSDVSQNKLK